MSTTENAPFISVLPKWNLSSLAPSYGHPDFDKYVREVNALVDSFSSVRHELGSSLSSGRFAALVKAYDAILTKSTRLLVCAYLKQSLDVQDTLSVTGLEKCEELCNG